MARTFYSFAAIVSQPTRLAFRMSTTGREHLPKTGGFILASNHISNFDPWPIALPLFPERKLWFMGKSELFKFPLTLLLNGTGVFPVRRDSRDLEAVETAVRHCREGDCVLLFPEGTRRPKGAAKTYVGRAHSGTARIALAAGVPIVPAAVLGTDRLRKLGPLRVAYGEPIPPEGTPRRITVRMMAAIESLLETL